MSGFKAAILYALTENGALALQVCSDFDFTHRSLDMSIMGKSHKFGAPYGHANQIEHLGTDVHNARCWSVGSQAQYDYAFNTFFRQYKQPNQVQRKPPINQLLLVPIELDMPIVANDMGDM